MTRTLTAIAINASQEYYSEAEAQSDDLFEHHREEIFSFARGKAAAVLGKEAAQLLTWEYTGTADLPPDTYEAKAFVDDSPAYLRYRLIDSEDVTFELVRPCLSCHQNRIDTVAHLAHLGSLLEAASHGR